jgi:hypothetical protein
MAALGAASTMAAISALMLLAPISSAATASVVFTHPFKHLGAQVSFGISHGACGKAHQIKSPVWSNSLGAFLAGGNAAAPVCKPSASQNFANWNSQVYLTMLLHPKANTSKTIVTTWTITMNSTIMAVPYTSCVLNYAVQFSTCAVEAFVEVFGYSYLYDQSNGSYFNFGSFAQMSNDTYAQNYSSNYCYGGTCYHYGGNNSNGASGTFTGTTTFNSTISATGAYSLTKGDTYQLSIVLFAYAYATAYTMNAKATGGGGAAASLNIGTHGNGALLSSIAIV